MNEKLTKLETDIHKTIKNEDIIVKKIERQDKNN